MGEQQEPKVIIMIILKIPVFFKNYVKVLSYLINGSEVRTVNLCRWSWSGGDLK